jgi:hypothetical protein
MNKYLIFIRSDCDKNAHKNVTYCLAHMGVFVYSYRA